MKLEKDEYAGTCWHIDDVMCEAEEMDVEITREEAEELLIEYDNYIVETMVEYGWDVIRSALEEIRDKK
jgi:hypothetical protein